MENNYNNGTKNKDIDLSNALDSTIEKKAENMYKTSLDTQTKNKKKNKVYILVIAISWIIIFAILLS